MVRLQACVCALLAVVCMAGMAQGSVEARMQAGLDRARQLLAQEKMPVLLEHDVAHNYTDKFTVVETMSSAALAAIANAFDTLSLEEILRDAEAGSVKLRLGWRTTVTAAGTEEIDGDKLVTASGSSKTVQYVLRKRYIWDQVHTLTLGLWRGSSPDAGEADVELAKAVVQHNLRTETERPPAAKLTDHTPGDVDLSWLLAAGRRLRINRHAKGCKTPTRNAEVETLAKHMARLAQFARHVQHAAGVAAGNAPLQSCGSSAFIPVLPLMERAGNDTEHCRPVGTSDLAALMEEHTATVAGNLRTCRNTAKEAGVPETLAMLATLGGHVQRLADGYLRAMEEAEAVLRRQLVAALGKEVAESEFEAFMVDHQQALLRDEYPLRGFSRAVRLEGHAPEGQLSLSTEGGDAVPTVIRKLAGGNGTRFALNSASEVALLGPTYLHTGVRYTYGEGAVQHLRLMAVAREFSSFVLLVGRISGRGRLAPEAALIVKNKDTLEVPLMLETIPPPAVFREFVSSLSEEQQRFAKQYRKMQLAGTLFAMAVVPIKPLMERALNLPENSLAKEFQLTHDLSELFIDYDVGGEMLAYDPVVDGTVPSAKEKVALVRHHADRVLQYIRNTRKKLQSEEAGSAEYQTYGNVRKKATFAASGKRGSAAPKKDEQGGRTSTEKPARAQQQARTQGDEMAAFPMRLEAVMDKYDVGRAMRPTLITPGALWQLRRRDSLVSPFSDRQLNRGERDRETQRSLLLLDALTKSGEEGVEHSELHVVVPVTHYFARSLMDMVVMENANPIEQVESSALLATASLFDVSAADVVRDEHKERLSRVSPHLLHREE